MSTKSFTSELNHQWAKAIDSVDGYLERLGSFVSKTLYHILGTIHLALVTNAGLFIMIFAPIMFHDQFIVEKSVSFAFLLGYMVCDLVRLPFRYGATISLGFPLIFLTLLADTPFAALRNVVLGSLVSEALRSIFVSKQRHPWFPALRRALFYAGHHAVAGWGALIVYQNISGRFFPQLLETTGIDIPAALAYIILYSLISMLLIWPHDRRIQLFLALDEEPFVRVDFLTTLLLLPLPAAVFYLFTHSSMEQKWPIAVGILPPLFILLFYLARNFTEVQEERERLALREEIGERLGSPANIAEMTERMLTIMDIERLVDYRWSAVYSLLNEELKLCGVKPAKGPLEILDLYETEEPWWPGGEPGKDKRQVAWPTRVVPGEGILGKLAKVYFPPQFFDEGREPSVPSEPYLPRKTALVVYPIRATTQGEAEQAYPMPIGMIALARPRRMFTTWEWERTRELSNKAGNVLLNVQRLERAIRELYPKVEAYATDPERVRQAMRELMQWKVDVPQFLAVVSKRSFQGSLRTVLRSLVEGRRGNEISLAPEVLTEIYNQVRDQTPGMPPLDPDIFRLLQTVTSSLSLAFSFPYQFPDVARGPVFKEFYRFLLVALDANTVSRIIVLGTHIKFTVKAIRGQERAMRETLDGRAAGLEVLPPEVLGEIEKLQEIVDLLREYGQTKDFTLQKASLDRALDLLREREGAVRQRLRDPERFIFLQILPGWRAAITNALEDLARGPAHLSVSLRSHQALPLEEVTASLILHNQGPGVASSVIVQLEPSPDYEVLRGKVDLGTLDSGRTEELEFALHPKGEGPLRLHFRATYHDPERKGKVEELADLLHLCESPIGFIEISNPYTPGSPLKPGNPTFVGREDIFNFIRQNSSALVQKTILVLVGERRTGKTSILKQLPARLNDPRIIPIYVDGQQLGIDPGERNFFLSLTTAMADGLEEAGVSTPRLTPEELGESPQYVFEQRFLPAVRERIRDRILLLTIDEFEELGARVSRGRLPPEIFPYLRHLIQHGDQLAFIFAGTHQIEEAVGDYWSVLFNIAVYKKVSFLNHEETVCLIKEPVRPYGMVYDDLAINEILRLTACHPYFTQLLCNILVNRCNDAQRNYVTIQNVREAVEELLETGRAHLTFLWQTSDREAQLTLAALAELRDRLDQVTTVAIADRLSRYQLPLDPGQIMKAMEQLVTRDIVREIPVSPVSYDFTARLHAHWLRRYKPLSKVVEEVSSEHIPEQALADAG